jgi:hypothetical protein
MQPVEIEWAMYVFKRSSWGGLSFGSPNISGTIKQGQVKTFTMNLPADPQGFQRMSGYSFLLQFPYGWNAFEYPPFNVCKGKWKFFCPKLEEYYDFPWNYEIRTDKLTRKTADLDILVENPDGQLLNIVGAEILEEETGLKIFQGASLNDLEAIHELSGYSTKGEYKITVVGFDVAGVPNNTVPFEVIIWRDNTHPLIP